jgi:hypothetical protein
MAQTGAGGKWSRKKARAALLVAEDRLTNERIAAAVGVSRRTLDRWKTEPAFMARVEEHIAAAEKAARSCGIARKMARVTTLNEVLQDLLRVKAERGADRAMQGVPGGQTGLVVKSVKQVGSGPSAQLIAEFELDPIWLREVRELGQQAARELGQWPGGAEADSPAPVALAQVVVATREDARAYLERFEALGGVPVIKPPEPEPIPVQPSFAEAITKAGPPPPAPDYQGPDGL